MDNNFIYIETKYKDETDQIIGYGRIKEGSPFAHHEEILIKGAHTISYRLSDGDTFSFRDEESVRRVRLKFMEA